MKRKSNSSHHGYKTFLEAIEASHLGSMKGKKFLKDNRLSFQEKKLLTCFLQVRENDFSFMGDLLSDNNFESHPFLKGVKHLILGFVHVYKAEAQLAEKHLEKAAELLQEGASERFVQRMLFKSHSNLFYAYVNQKKFKEMGRQFKKVSNLTDLSDEDKISFKLMEICQNSMTGEYSKAEEHIKEMESLLPAMTDIQIISYLIEKFDFFVKLDFLENAQNVLKEMKKYRTFRLSACFQYMDKLLKFVKGGDRIYIYDKDFVEHDDLYLMIKVICKLDEADFHEASFSWAKLAAKAPQTYLPEFQYKGDKCLFSIALEKSLNKKEIQPVILQKSYSDLERKLIQSLLEAPNAQIKKEEIYQLIYGKELSSKDDLFALAAFIYRINKKEEVLIKSKKGSYFMALRDQKTA